MSVDVYCRCGQRLQLAGRTVCPACGRGHVVLAGGRALPVAIAVGAAFAVVAVGLLGALIGSYRSSEERSREPIARIAPDPEPAPIIFQPAPPAVVPLPIDTMPPAPVPVLPPEPAPVPPPPDEPRPRAGILESKIEPAGRYKVGDVLRQDVHFARKSAYQIAGVDFGQSAEYGFQSSIVIAKVNADGSLVAVQTVVVAKLIDADRDSKAALADALEKAQGTKFEIAVAANGDVTAIEGLKDPIRVERKDADPTRSLRLWSLLDADAWKELAGLTFFQPGAPLKPKATWSKPAVHDWGPLGRWSGKTVYAAAGKQPGRTKVERIDFRHDIAHVPPKAGADRELPIRIAKADFRTVGAGGAILYDPAASRATAADELFRVRGSLIVTLDGLNAVIAMEEQQAFRLTIDEPKEQALVGRPPAKESEPKNE